MVVALKALRDGNVEALFRLKREFRALADLAHTNLVRLHELLAREDQWFFTMELIDGVNFLEYVRGTPFPNRGESGCPPGPCRRLSRRARALAGRQRRGSRTHDAGAGAVARSRIDLSPAAPFRPAP